MGFDQKFFDIFKKKLDSLEDKRAKNGVLSFDEMQVRKALDVNVKDMTFNCLVDFGKNILNEQSLPASTPKKGSNENQKLTDNLADHALVFMFSSLTQRFSQPIGMWLCKSSTNSNTLCCLLITTIIAVEKCGSRVQAVVCDGAQNNRRIWKDLGISANPADVKCYFDNPYDESADEGSDSVSSSSISDSSTTMESSKSSNESAKRNHKQKRRVYFVSDAPHLIKCIRNRLFNDRELKVLFISDSIYIFNKYGSRHDILWF